MASAPLDGQEPTRVWLGIGPASGVTTDFEGGLGVLTRIVGRRSPHQAEFRAIGMGNFESFPDGGDGSVTEVSLLYGRSKGGRSASVAVSAGLSVVSVEGLTGGEPSNHLGLPLSAEAALQSQFVGLGLQLFGNLNTGSSFAGLALVLHLGWMPR